MPRSIARAAARTVPLADLAASWELALRSENKSPRTIASYAASVAALTRWLAAQGTEPDTAVTTEQLRAFLASELGRVSARGRPMSPASVAVDFRNLRVFFGWLAAEEPALVPVSPMTRVGKPAVPPKSKPPFSDADQRALLKCCSGPGFDDRRDTAIMRIFMDTGLRVSGMAGLRWDPAGPGRSDVDLPKRQVTVRLKGGREIIVPLGARAAAAADRYIRARRTHPSAAQPWLWLGRRGRFTVHGVGQMLNRRGAQAGVTHVHPHRFRATFAHDWLQGGGTESDLMEITGWTTRDMIEVYAGELAAERARHAHARLSPGDRI